MEYIRAFFMGFGGGLKGIFKRIGTAMILLAVIESAIRVLSDVVRDVNSKK